MTAGHHETLPITDLRTYHTNPRLGNIETIAESLKQNGQYRPIVVNKGTHTGRPYEVLAGNHTLKAHRLLTERTGTTTWAHIDCWLVDVDEDHAARIVLADNRTADLGTYDDTALIELLSSLDDLTGTGYEYDDLEGLLEDTAPPLSTTDDEDTTTSAQEDDDEGEPSLALAERYGLPPLTVIDTRRGEWKARRKAWDSRGIESEQGRDEKMLYTSPQTLYENWYDVRNKAADINPEITNQQVADQYKDQLKPFAGRGGTSTFDPVLAELLYSWFAPPRAKILDPWAGGSVRGIVATQLGHHYTGHELREEQVAENQHQYTTYRDKHQPEGDAEWITGDSRRTLQQHAPGSYHMAMGCPPYYDLETYSDDPEDLSNLTTEQFDAAMLDTLKGVDRALTTNSFACFIVGSVRDRRGDLRDMRALMVNCAEKIGWKLANDAVLLNAVGTVAIRAGRGFSLGRSLGRVHQDILVFVKGDRKKAAKTCGETVNMLQLEEECATNE